VTGLAEDQRVVDLTMYIEPSVAYARHVVPPDVCVGLLVACLLAGLACLLACLLCFLSDDPSSCIGSGCLPPAWK